MGTILPNRVIELVLLLAECQYLHPVLAVFVAEDPPAIILDFKNDDALWCRNGKVYLGICPVRLADIKVVVDCALVDAAFIE